MPTDSIETLFSLDFRILGIQTLALIITAIALPKLKITGPLGALCTVLALALVNAKLWDAALFFHIPDSFSIHAISLFVTNGVLFFILVKILPGIELKGLLPAFYAPVVFTICSLFISEYIDEVDWQAVWTYTYDTIVALKEYFLESKITNEQ